jgi:hypothetical protein
MSQAVLDFEFAAGTLIHDQYDGVAITANQRGSKVDEAMVFDSANPTGNNDDLAYDERGGILIISKDGDTSDPDDSARGGTLSFNFEQPVDLTSVILLDAERGAWFVGYDDQGSVVGRVFVRRGADNDERTIDLSSLTGVSRLVAHIRGSGALDDLAFVANTAPEIEPLTLLNPENQTIAGFVRASDVDGDDLTWSITGGSDGDLFEFEFSDTRSDIALLKFKVAPDFESPGDNGLDNVYEVEVSVNDGTETTTRAVQVEVTNLSEINGVVTPAERTFTISANASAETLIADFNFDDPDTPLDDADSFGFLESSAEDPFQLATDGQLTLALPEQLDQLSYQRVVGFNGEFGVAVQRVPDFQTGEIEELQLGSVSQPNFIITIQVDDLPGAELAFAAVQGDFII